MADSVADSFKHSSPVAVCRHISRILQTGVYYLRADNSVHYAFTSGQPSAQAFNDGLFRALFGGERRNEKPAIKTTRPGEAYIGVDLWEQDRLIGRLAAGPILDTAEALKSSHCEYAVSTAILLYHLVYEKWVEEKELTDIISQAAALKEEGDNIPSVHRQQGLIRHHSIAYENQIYSLITEGNEKKLREVMKAPPDGAYGILDKRHPLRNLKNDCICVITLATRAAVAGGLDVETAFSASDDAIQNLELCEDIHSLYQLIEQTLCRLAQAVESTRNLLYSCRISRCRNYVIHHVYEKITVSSIASRFGLSTEYLSGQFKRETGIRLVDFIQKTKAEEAKKLLVYTDKPILEIASLLYYHDQSHLTKSFKKVFGLTPGDCRKETGNIERA